MPTLTAPHEPVDRPTGPRRLPLNKRTVAALGAPERGTSYAYDADVRGLAVAVTASGARSWYVCRRCNGRAVRLRLGAVADLTPEQARRLAGEAIAKMAAGHDPMQARRADRERMRFGDLFEEYVREHATPRLAPRTLVEYQRVNETLLDAFRGRALAELDRPSIAAWHARCGREHGHSAANRALATLGAALTFALRRGYIDAHPARGVERFREESRERFISPEEMPRFLKAVRAEKNADARDAIMLLLLTGARRSNVLGMRWEDIGDLFNGAPTWTIPRTKNGKPLLLPLGEDAVAVLRGRHGPKSKSVIRLGFVFPGDGATGTIVELKRAWRRVLKRAKIAELTMHDLRRTCGSWLAASGVSLPMIGRLLGHTEPRSTAIYARLALDPIREALNGTMGRLMLTAGGER